MRSSARDSSCERRSRVVMCVCLGPRCMRCCIGAVWRCGRGDGVVVVSGVYSDRASWCSRAVLLCKAVEMSRERLCWRSRVACVVPT
jgi:hypothetical protein